MSFNWTILNYKHYCDANQKYFSSGAFNTQKLIYTLKLEKTHKLQNTFDFLNSMFGIGRQKDLKLELRA